MAIQSNMEFNNQRNYGIQNGIQQSMYRGTYAASQNGKLLKGMLIGSLVGAAAAMLDAGTRNKLKHDVMSMKDKGSELFRTIKADPQEFVEQIKHTAFKVTDMAKDVGEDLKKLSEKVSVVQDQTSTLASVAKDATADLKQVGSKVADAGHEVMNDSQSIVNGAGVSTASTTSTDSSGMIYADNANSTVTGKIVNAQGNPVGTEDVKAMDSSYDKIRDNRKDAGMNDYTDEHTKKLGY